MKLSNKARYAVRAMFDIAYHGRGEATQVKAIAERQAVPHRFLEQIFQDLKRAALVTSKRGPRGGYALMRSPETIRIGDILRATGGPVAFQSPDAAALAGDSASRAVTEGVFS
ncbi:MAG: Rrf2 family transcriptional regulator, partial [Myxococcota bacterium]